MAQVGKSQAGEWSSILVLYGLIIALVAFMWGFWHLISGWTPRAVFWAEQATVTEVIDCDETKGEGPGSGESSHCDVEWRLPDGTEGGGRIEGTADLVAGSTVYVDGDQGYYSRSAILWASFPPASFAAPAVVTMLVYGPVTLIRARRRDRPERALLRARKRHHRQARRRARRSARRIARLRSRRR